MVKGGDNREQCVIERPVWSPPDWSSTLEGFFLVFQCNSINSAIFFRRQGQRSVGSCSHRQTRQEYYVSVTLVLYFQDMYWSQISSFFSKQSRPDNSFCFSKNKMPCLFFLRSCVKGGMCDNKMTQIFNRTNKLKKRNRGYKHIFHVLA